MVESKIKKLEMDNKKKDMQYTKALAEIMYLRQQLHSIRIRIDKILDGATISKKDIWRGYGKDVENK